jgi:hypothetical protein
MSTEETPVPTQERQDEVGVTQCATCHRVVFVTHVDADLNCLFCRTVDIDLVTDKAAIEAALADTE